MDPRYVLSLPEDLSGPRVQQTNLGPDGDLGVDHRVHAVIVGDRSVEEGKRRKKKEKA
jgi:hypothetical protein